MQHTDIRLFLVKDRMETLQREAQVEAAYRRARTPARLPDTEPAPDRLSILRLFRPAFLRFERG